MAKDATLTPELFGKTLNRWIEMVVFGKAHVKIGLGLGNLLKGDPAIAQVSPVFWGTSLNAQADIAQLIAFKLFDTHKGTATIFYLLEQARNPSNVFGNANPVQVESIVQAAFDKISGPLSKPLKQIRAKRNRVLAHLDRTLISDPEKVATQAKVTWSDLNVIFDISGQILNDVSVGFRDSSPMWDLIGSEDYTTAFDLISDARCAKIKTYESEFGARDGPRPSNCF
jgi:hypothetical protein